MYRGGKSVNGHYVSLFFKSNAEPRHRFGFTASRKFSTRAVDRNRAKRIMRAAIRLTVADFARVQMSHDFVLNARRAMLNAKSFEIANELVMLLQRVYSMQKPRSVIDESVPKKPKNEC